MSFVLVWKKRMVLMGKKWKRAWLGRYFKDLFHFFTYWNIKKKKSGMLFPFIFIAFDNFSYTKQGKL